MRALAVVVAVTALALPAAALANGKVFYEDTIKSGTSSLITVTTQKPAAFRILLRVPTQGRAKLFRLGKTAPAGGPLIDTKTYACEGAAGSFFCKAVYKPLPKGKYTWRVSWAGVAKKPAHVELTVRW